LLTTSTVFPQVLLTERNGEWLGSLPVSRFLLSFPHFSRFVLERKCCQADGGLLAPREEIVISADREGGGAGEGGTLACRGIGVIPAFAGEAVDALRRGKGAIAREKCVEGGTGGKRRSSRITEEGIGVRGRACWECVFVSDERLAIK
jgi:hypothetical protein